MIPYIQEIINFYFGKMRVPEISELSEKKDSLELAKKGACFVTLYKNGEIRGSAGNIKEIHESLAEEILANIDQALKGDYRFGVVKSEERDDIQFRLDVITHREMLEFSEIQKIDPTKFGIIAIMRNYEKLAVILPNISPKIITVRDALGVLEKKLGEKRLSDTLCIFYKIQTKIETSY